MGPNLDMYITFQIIPSQLDLPQVDSHQVVEISEKKKGKRDGKSESGYFIDP